MTLLTSLLTGAVTALAVAVGLGFDLRRLANRRQRARSSQQWLLQAGVELTPRQFWFGSVVAGGVTFALLVVITATPAVAVVPALAVALLPRAYFARRRTQRLRDLQEAWPDGIRDLVASISAGLSLHQALIALARSGPEVLRAAFDRYPTTARTIGVVPALELVKERLADPTSDRVIEVLILAHERGAPLLSDVLRDLAEATTRDVRALEEMTTESLEQRINARAVFVLPWIVLLLLTAREGFFQDFYRSPAGLLVVAVGGVLSLTGVAIVSRLSREPIEPRVLGRERPPGGGR